jgi:hypothetical protein
MDELRAEHLGAEVAAKSPSVGQRLQAAYQAAVARAGA